jgi:hypothetical protein
MHRHPSEAAAALTRRRFLTGAGAVAVAGVITALSARRASAAAAPAPMVLGTQPPGLPERQHAWTRWLHRDEFGNPVAPRFDRLLFFDVRGRPTGDHAALLESRLRTLERLFHWGPEGLLFTVGYGPDYFSRVLGVTSPIETAVGLSSFETPAIDSYHLCLHLACDDEQRLADVETALRGRGRLRHAPGAQLSLAPILIWRETRTGFTGTKLPQTYERVRGIPSGNPVPKDSPLFMGFKSGLKKNQATEDDVTIPGGAFAQGTTMQVSYMLLALDDWYGQLSAAERVARMYSPQTTVAGVKRLRTDASAEPNKLIEAIRRYGVIGHAQTSAQARRHNRPVIIRRDFDTIDGGQAGLHFVSLQRSIQDFVATRNAMNAAEAHKINPAITATANNGINAFMDVRRRANYILPSRRDRSFPLLAEVTGSRAAQ